MRKLIFVALLLLGAATADAASLKICWDAATINADVASIEAYGGATLLYPDVWAGAVQDGAKYCATKPFPSTLVRGTNVAVTLKAVNSLGEASAASNAVTFRAPLVPPVLTGVTVQGLSAP